jgi:hypothetical protein
MELGTWGREQLGFKECLALFDPKWVVNAQHV